MAIKGTFLDEFYRISDYISDYFRLLSLQTILNLVDVMHVDIGVTMHYVCMWLAYV